MNALKLDITKSGVTITPDMEKAALEANALLYSGKGAGNDFLGWVHLPSSISAADIEAIEAEAAKLRAKATWSSASASAARTSAPRRCSRR